MEEILPPEHFRIPATLFSLMIFDNSVSVLCHLLESVLAQYEYSYHILRKKGSPALAEHGM